ncbi:hypothetical protein Tco_1139228 [Tanacetum coccineum]
MPSLNSGNARNPNRVENIQTDNTNNTGTTNVTHNVVTEDLPQLLDFRRGSHVTNVPPFDVDGFSSWKDMFLVYLDGLEPYLLEIPFVPKSPASTSENVLIKPQKQCLLSSAPLLNLCENVQGIFTGLKILLNDLETKGVSIPQDEVNATFVNSLPRKWLSMNQTQRANNSIKNDSLDSNSKALIFNTYFQDIDSDVEEDTRSSSEFLANLNAEFHDKALLAN